MINFFLVLLTLVMGCTTLRPKTMDEFQKTSVLVASNSGGGGSGVIYRSSSKGTLILTNAHICEVISTGGVVVDTTTHSILAYKKSTKHDLCLLLVEDDLDINTVVAPYAPKRNSKVYASGHPSLYPHIVSEGYVSGIDTYSIHTDTRPCSKVEALADPVECILDGKAISTEREAQVISALVSPGSSGSAVFNTQGELVGLVFATSGNIGYALTVPWKYLDEFVKHEVRELKWEKTDPNKTRNKYSNSGIYDLDNWKQILKLINEKNKCLRLCP